MATVTSQELWEKAKRLMPGGVNSPVRAFRAVGGDPFFIARGQGPYVHTEDGRRLIDYLSSWGPLILGHAHPDVVEAISRTAANGTSFGAPSRLEVEMAERVVEAFPSVERVRMVNSGTEATMSAVRLARAATGRSLILKFAGCYHGHVDALMARAGSGMATLGIPSSPGVTESTIRDTAVIEYNDLEAVEAFFHTRGKETAAVIVEPMAGNMGVVPPAPGFLETLRELTKKAGAILIFDEVITGFRLGYSGAQGKFGVMPDLTCFGKVIGGGLPVGAYGGRADLMSRVAPEGEVYQAGTLSGNPLAMAAGLATLEKLREPGFYDQLEKKVAAFSDGLHFAAREAGVPVTLNREGTLFTLFMTDGPVRNFTDADRSSREAYKAFFHGLLSRGVFFPPAQFECVFVSQAHTDDVLEETLQAARETFKEMAGGAAHGTA